MGNEGTTAPASADGQPVVGRDSQDLASFGYRQKLARQLGSFSSFAAGFSYLSILTGLFQSFYLGFHAGGAAFFWTWPLVLAGQFLVALCFAELAAHYPLSGSVYQWIKQLGHRTIGWLAGWIYLASLIVTIASIGLALQIILPHISPSFQIIGDISSAPDRARNAVLLGCLLIAFSTLLNSVGVRFLAALNNLGVFTELVGIVLLILLLALRAIRGPEVVFDTQARGLNSSLGYLGSFLTAAALSASYVMYGFDTAGTLAEETKAPRRTAPRAILQALAAAGISGSLLILAALMAAPALDDPRLGEDNGGLPHIVHAALGPQLGTVFLWDVIFALVVCELAVQAGTIRLMYAMARDHNLPFAATLARVSPGSRTPILPAVVSGLLAVAILVVNIDFPNVIALVMSMAILWTHLAYLLVTLLLLVQRLRGWPAKGGSGAEGIFTLGRWGLPLNLLAVIWGALIVVNIGWPRAGGEAASPYQQYATLLCTAGLVLAGSAYYYWVQRHKSSILAEHRA